MDSLELQQRYPIAFMQGVRACLKGKEVDQNPHTRPCSPVARTEFHAWEAGYEDTIPYGLKEVKQ